MNIGVVGVGMVGHAIQYGFMKLGHNVKIHDIRLNTSIDDVLDTEICFICVPTPQTQDGKCDVSIVESVIHDLKENKNYDGIVAIKSTVEPGTTQRLQRQYLTHKICFVPEFLRERCAVADFIENHDVCIVGTDIDDIFNLVKQAHGHYPKRFVKVSPTEAELCKYFNNTFNATLVVFANSFYEVCKKLKVNYTNVKNAVVNRHHITDLYLDCNENFRGFGGYCLPKDTAAMDHLAKELGTNVSFFRELLEENAKYAITVYDGMRSDPTSEKIE